MRVKKNKDQIKVLENEYLKFQDWSREYMKYLADKLGLRESQVYKWHWDQKKKEVAESNSKKF